MYISVYIMYIWYGSMNTYAVYTSARLDINATYACICELDENKKHIHIQFCLLYFPQYVWCDHWGLL